MEEQKIEFAIIVASYNNESWCQDNINSIASQEYPYFHLYYINDCSTDDTADLAEIFCSRNETLKGKYTLIHNKERKGSLTNIYETIHLIDPHKVIVCVDGDDKLAHEHVLDILAAVYKGPEVWLTYGSLDTEPSSDLVKRHPYPAEVLQKATFRDEPFLGSHLKTFYAKLFQKIEKKDLMWNGSFFPIAGDAAFMFPMLEMASPSHIHFIPDVLYIYNIYNQLSDAISNRKLQEEVGEAIRKHKRYAPLKQLW